MSKKTSSPLPATSPPLILRHVQGSRRGRVDVVEDAVVLGRSADSPVSLDPEVDRLVSATHARLTPHPRGTWWIEDVGSTNGTLVNGRPLARPRELGEGDVVWLGAPDAEGSVSFEIRLGRRAADGDPMRKAAGNPRDRLLERLGHSARRLMGLDEEAELHPLRRRREALRRVAREAAATLAKEFWRDEAIDLSAYPAAQECARYAPRGSPDPEAEGETTDQGDLRAVLRALRDDLTAYVDGPPAELNSVADRLFQTLRALTPPDPEQLPDWIRDRRPSPPRGDAGEDAHPARKSAPPRPDRASRGSEDRGGSPENPWVRLGLDLVSRDRPLFRGHPSWIRAHRAVAAWQRSEEEVASLRARLRFEAGA